MLLLATYHPTNLLLSQDVHLVTAKYSPDRQGHVLFGISDESENKGLCTANEQEMCLIQNEFKRFVRISIILICEYYVNRAGRDYHLQRLEKQQHRLTDLPQSFYRIRTKRDRYDTPEALPLEKLNNAILAKLK